MVADIAHGFLLASDFLSSLENPLSSFVFLCGVLYLLQAGLGCLRSEIYPGFALWHKEAYNRFFPCMEATYPYAIKNQRKARNAGVASL